MSDNPISQVVNVKHGKRESASTLLEADNLSVRSADDGSLILELFRYGAAGRVLESFQFILCPEDTLRADRELSTILRRRAAK